MSIDEPKSSHTHKRTASWVKDIRNTAYSSAPTASAQPIPETQVDVPTNFNQRTAPLDPNFSPASPGQQPGSQRNLPLPGHSYAAPSASAHSILHSAPAAPFTQPKPSHHHHRHSRGSQYLSNNTPNYDVIHRSSHYPLVVQPSAEHSTIVLINRGIDGWVVLPQVGHKVTVIDMSGQGMRRKKKKSSSRSFFDL